MSVSSPHLETQKKSGTYTHIDTKKLTRFLNTHEIKFKWHDIDMLLLTTRGNQLLSKGKLQYYKYKIVLDVN